MKRRITVKTGDAKAMLPTYQELANLVAELAVINIANIDGKHRFVSCFTYAAGNIPPHWQRAIDAREALIEHLVVERTAKP